MRQIVGSAARLKMPEPLAEAHSQDLLEETRNVAGVPDHGVFLADAGAAVVELLGLRLRLDSVRTSAKRGVEPLDNAGRYVYSLSHQALGSTVGCRYAQGGVAASCLVLCCCAWWPH